MHLLAKLFLKQSSVDVKHIYCNKDLAIDRILYLPCTLLQASMDLPPDKAKILRNYDEKKKWELICDQVK